MNVIIIVNDRKIILNVNQKPTKKNAQRLFFFSTEEVDVSIHILNDHVDFLNEKNKYYTIKPEI